MAAELAPHAQPRAARHPRRLRGGGRLAAGRGSLGRRRDPVRARGAGPLVGAALLLPAQTRRFLVERAGTLERLPSYVAAVQGIIALPDVPAYLAARGRRGAGSDPRAQADAALQAFLSAMWEDATDFAFDAERFGAAFAELEDAAYGGCALSLVVTPVEGLVIESEEVTLGDG